MSPLLMGDLPSLTALADVVRERARQERLVAEGKFPWTCADPAASDAYKLAVLAEEFGEVAKALLVGHGDSGASGNLRTELIQVAAVAVAWVEAIDGAAT